MNGQENNKYILLDGAHRVVTSYIEDNHNNVIFRFF